MDPPANAQASNPVCQKDGDEAVLGPFVSDTQMAEVMNGEDELVPEPAEAYGTQEEPLFLIGQV